MHKYVLIMHKYVIIMHKFAISYNNIQVCYEFAYMSILQAAISVYKVLHIENATCFNSMRLVRFPLFSHVIGQRIIRIGCTK